MARYEVDKVVRQGVLDCEYSKGYRPKLGSRWLQRFKAPAPRLEAEVIV